ncbi:MAG: IPT/TIG domain-containing protein, partial [Planctomycetes bacterium]|nr:IPT/TIG domain-containing protein [Planctomycetota bacterium]
MSRSETEDGSRFMMVSLLSPNPTPVADSVEAEIEAVGFTGIPSNASLPFRFDFRMTSTGSQSFNRIEIMMPEGFRNFTSLSLEDVSDNNRVLAEYLDYTVDNSSGRNVAIMLTTDRGAGEHEFTARFSIRSPAAIQGLTEKAYEFGLLVDLSVNDGSVPVTVPKYAVAHNFVNNGGGGSVDGLKVQVETLRKISGTITFGTALEYDTVVRVSLYNSTGQTFVTDSPGISPSTVVAGTSSVEFTLSQLPGSELSGLDDGDYSIKVEAFGYQTQWIGLGSPLSIINGSSVDGLGISLVAESIQGWMVIDKSNIAPGTNVLVNLTITPTFTSETDGDSNPLALDRIDVGFEAVAGSGIGSFDYVSLAGTELPDGVSVVSSAVDQGNGYVSIFLSGYDYTLSGNDVVLVLDVAANVDQRDVFELKVNLTASDGVRTAAGASSDPEETRILMIISSAPVSIMARDYEVFLGVSFSTSIGLVGTEYLIEPWISETGLATADMGVSLNSAGLLSGTPNRTSKNGFPFVVRADYEGPDGEIGYTTASFTLYVYKIGFDIFSVEPVAVPSTGGEIVIKGRGFTPDSVVSVGGFGVQFVFVNEETLVVDVPA